MRKVPFFLRVLWSVSFLSVVGVLLAACAPKEPKVIATCPLPIVTKDGGMVKTAGGSVGIVGVSGSCKVTDDRKLFVRGQIRLVFSGKPPKSNLLVVLMRDKKTPVYRRIIALQGKKGKDSVAFRVDNISIGDHFSGSYGLFITLARKSH